MNDLFGVRSLCLALVVLSLCSCSYSTPITRTVSAVIPGVGPKLQDQNLDPKLRYLRVAVRGRVALMVLGYLEPAAGGEIETWYSSEGELLRLQNGRLVGTSGLETDWRIAKNVSFPAWKDLAMPKPVTYQRERDEMPGYRFGIAEMVSLYPIPVPTNAQLVGLPAQNLRWFEETVIGQSDGKPIGLPSARYALRTGEPRVVYGEQCLSRTLCIAWQTWPATP